MSMFEVVFVNFVLNKYVCMYISRAQAWLTIVSFRSVQHLSDEMADMTRVYWRHAIVDTYDLLINSCKNTDSILK